MSGSPTSEINPTVAENNFHALKEVKRAINNNDLATLKKVVGSNPGLDLDQLLDDGDTFLIMAIKLDYREIRNFLLEKGCGLDKSNIAKDTPLHIAVKTNRVNTVKVLLDRKIDLELKNADGDTPLLTAIKNANDEIALLLLKNGASFEARDKTDFQAWQIAQGYMLPLANDFMIRVNQVEFGAPDIATFRKILIEADIKNLSRILTRYPKLASDYESINPLAIVIDLEDQFIGLKSAQILLENKANVNGPKNAEEIPLIKATQNQKEDFAKLLLSREANPQLIDAQGKSALIHAVELNNPALVDLLLSYSAPEKYTFRKDGKKVTVNACSVAKTVAKRLTVQADKLDNQQIRKSLDCGLFSGIL